MRAVPSEAPRLVAVFCDRRPQRSAGLAPLRQSLLPAARRVHRFRRRSTASGQGRSPPTRPGSSPPTKTAAPADMSSRPMRDTRRGEAIGQILGMPSARASSENDSGTRRMPVSMADSSRATTRNSGIVKKMPDCRKNWKPNSVSPPRSCATRRMEGGTSGSPRSRSRCTCQSKEEPQQQESADDQPDDEVTEQDRRFRLGLDQPPVARAQHPEDEQPKACRRQRGAQHVYLRAHGGRRIRDPTPNDQDDDHHDDLAGEHPAPGGEVVSAPPISGPTATAQAPAAAISPYAPARPSRGTFEATRATMAGRIKAAPIPSSSDQPKRSTGRFGAMAVIPNPARR